MWPDTPEVEMVLRAPVAPGTTVDSTFAAPLVVSQNMASEFVDLLVPATIVGRIPGIRRVPFNITIPRETTGASVGWVGEAAPKPVSAMAFDSISLAFTKVAGIVPISQELMRFSSPSAEGLIRDSLIRAVAYLTDRDFLDPSKAAVTRVNPASITNGVTAVASTGTTADALRADLRTLIQTFAAANVNLSGLVLVMTSQQAIAISMMVNTLGQYVWPDMGPNGGTLAGIPVITSENMVATGSSPTDGGMIVAINAPDVLLADDGQVTIDISTEASLQMESAPDSPATASTTFVSMFQQNLVAIRAERFIHWLKRRSGAVQYISYARYA
jgi:HK97 family phage major capsid protein